MNAEIEPAGTQVAVAPQVRNWKGDLVSYPRVVTEARTVEDIVAVLQDPDTYPAPVRAHGSSHTTTCCGAADGGTVIKMRKMDRIIRVTADTVTTEAGALYIDVAKELERRNLQFYVNMELGNATMGSIACCATKDASMPGEHGEVNSYCVAMKMVTPSGDIVEITEDEPDLLQAARSSYGLFGVVYEVTMRIRPLQAMSVRHVTYGLDEFIDELPSLTASGESMMMYMFPFQDRVVVEFRTYTGEEGRVRPKLPNRLVWQLRNLAWAGIAPAFGYLAEKYVPWPSVRYLLIDWFNRIVQVMTSVLSAPNTVPTDQMIRYPEISDWTRYTFSFWAFPQERYAETLREYFDFAKAYYRDRGWRPNLPHVGYRVEQDQSSLFSYSYDAVILTIDPVSTGAPGWTDFLAAYNEFCSQHDGKPLFNQTGELTRSQVRRAFGERIERFEEYRRGYDPEDRLLNHYFRELFVASAA